MKQTSGHGGFACRSMQKHIGQELYKKEAKGVVEVKLNISLSFLSNQKGS